jgi:pimeloyl-ACP methyl ester carboxylesterase
MEEPTARRTDVRGCTISVRRAGAGRPLLYLHGASDAGLWSPSLTDLAARHDVIAPEHPGFGASDTPAWLDTIADLSSFYLDLLDRLDLIDVHLVGHDLGGWIAADLAVRNTRRLASLTLVGAAGIFVPSLAQVDPFLRTDEQRLRDLFHDPAQADEMVTQAKRPEFEDICLKNQTAAARLTWQPRGYDPHLAKWLHRVDVPTLLVWGANDRVYPRELGDAYAKLIPDATLVVVPDCGHLPHIERREAFVAALAEFLEHDPEKWTPVFGKDHAQLRSR